MSDTIDRAAYPDIGDALERLRDLVVLARFGIAKAQIETPDMHPPHLGLVLKGPDVYRIAALWEGGDFLADLEAALGEVERLRQECEDLELSASMACENPPEHCPCPGCSIATEHYGATVQP